MFSGTGFWWLGLHLLLAAPYCSLTYPEYYMHSLRLREDAPRVQPEGLYKGPSQMGFSSVAVKPNSLVFSRRSMNSAAVNMNPSSAGQQSGGWMGSSYGGNVPDQGSPSSWGAGPADSSRSYGHSGHTAVDGSTFITNHRPVTSQPTGNTGYRPVESQSKGSGSYWPNIQPPKPEVYSGQYRPYLAKPTPGKDEETIKQVLVKPNRPAWSTKQSSAAVGESTSGVHYKPVTSPSRGSMNYRPTNQQLKPSTSSGQYRPYSAKPSDIKQVLVRPNSPVGGSTSSVHYKPVTSPSGGSMSYRPANQQQSASTSSVQGQYRPYSAKPTDIKQVLVRPNSPVGGSTSSVHYKPVTSRGSTSYRPANQQQSSSTSSGQYRPYSSASSAMMPSGSFGSAQAQWAQAEAASSTYGQTGQPAWQSQAASMSSSSQNSVSQSHGASHSHGGYEAENPQQGEDSIFMVIPSHLGVGVIEMLSRAERQKMRNEEDELRPAAPNKGWGYISYVERI